jgi:hypothetical protein
MAQERAVVLQADDKVVFEKEVKSTWKYQAPLYAVTVTTETTTLIPDINCGDKITLRSGDSTVIEIDEDDVDGMVLGVTRDMKIPRKETSAFATPLDVMVFLISHMHDIKVEKLLFRLTGIKTLAKNVMAGYEWNNLHCRNEGRVFTPTFWVRLFKRIKCTLAPEYVEKFSIMKRILTKMPYVPNPNELARSLMIISFLCYLREKNLLSIISGKKLMELIVGRKRWHGTDLTKRAAVTSQLREVITEVAAMEPDEEMWVHLFSTSLYQGREFHPYAFYSGRVPEFESMAIARKAREAEEKRVAEETVRLVGERIKMEEEMRAEEKEKERKRLAAIEAASDIAPPLKTPPEQPPSLYPILTQPTPQFLTTLLENPYRCYAVQTPDDVKLFTTVLDTTLGSGLIRPIKVEKLLTFPPNVDDLIHRFGEQINKTISVWPYKVIKSLMVALMGGDDACWEVARSRVFTGAEGELGTKLDRKQLNVVSPDALDWLLRQFITNNRIRVSDPVMLETDKVIAKLPLPLRFNDVSHEQFRVYLTLLYDPESWKARWQYNGWDTSPKMEAAVKEALLAVNSGMSPVVRAHVISLIRSVF